MARFRHLRLTVQALTAALTNGYAAGFVNGSIYKGGLKQLCVPGLNCYSCPGALGSCPLGALQNGLINPGGRAVLYVVGFLTVVGALAGRLVCGWLCPFGLMQDLLHKIPFLRKWKRKQLPGRRILQWLRYGILVGFVILLPLFAVDAYGQPSPWFCKLICPVGTLEGGIPLLAANEPLRAAVGWLFAWKFVILAALLLLSVLVYRPFCQYLCPLGAVYGLFNPIALYRYRVDETRCTKCGACEAACPIGLSVFAKPNSMECIRCGKCIQVCPPHALQHTLSGTRCKNKSEK